MIKREPDFMLNYNKEYTFIERVDDFINWFVKFDLELGFISFDEPYNTGVKFGPDSDEYMKKIDEIDKQLGMLLFKLQKAKLLDKMNIILVSDAGIASFKDTILFKDLLDEKLINFNQSAYDVVSNIRPFNESLVLFFIIFCKTSYLFEKLFLKTQRRKLCIIN